MSAGKAEIQDGIQAAATAIADLETRYRGERPLTFYLSVGRAVRKRLGGKYGAWVGLAEALAKRGIGGLGVNNLHKCSRFAEVFAASPPQVRMLNRKEVSWRSASALTSSNLRPAQRLQLIFRVSEGLLQPDDLMGEIEKRLSADATATTKSVNTAHRRAADAVELLQRVAGNAKAPTTIRQLARSRLKNLAGTLA